MKQLRVADGTRIAYELTGQPAPAQTVALCDGISCDGYIWRELRPWLEARYRVLHMRYRGHGRSGLPRDPAAVTLAHLAGDLDEVMARESLDSAVFIGHSMGVQVILETAWRFPSRVAAGVLLCGSYGRALDTFRGTDIGARLFPYIESLGRRHRSVVSRAFRALMPTRFSYAMATLGEVKGELISLDDFMPYLDHFARMPIDLFLRMLEDVAQRTTYDILPRLQQPLLVVAGRDDHVTPVHTSETIARRAHDATCVVIEGASHTGPLERPREFNRAIEQFLESLDGKTLASPRATTLANAMVSRFNASPHFS